MKNYNTKNLANIDSPSLLIYVDIVTQNIDKMIAIAGNTDRLMPHIKTNKMENIVQMMIEKGIISFKCATIAEAELAAKSGAKNAIIAHQLVGPKIKRLLDLIKKYPKTKFASIVDCNEIVDQTNALFKAENLKANVYYDINNGMDRSGHQLNNELEKDILYAAKKNNISLKGLHVYDGHIHEENFVIRQNSIEIGMIKIYELLEKIKPETGNLEIIAGGTPAFTTHTLASNRMLSPGTCVLWDWGYGDKFKEQPFEYAAVIMTRIISKPKPGLITVDMGHKAVSAENPIDKRIRFLNHNNLKLISQSEEHGVIETENWNSYKVGDILLGVPYHVCPTVNLYDEAQIIKNDNYLTTWQIEGRKRKITI
jgi:3-hydroxy-D-aspartate aldolase